MTEPQEWKRKMIVTYLVGIVMIGLTTYTLLNYSVYAAMCVIGWGLFGRGR